MPKLNEDDVRGLRGRMTGAEDARSQQLSEDDILVNTRTYDPSVTRQPLRHRDLPALEGRPLRSGVIPDLRPATGDHKLLNRATGEENRSLRRERVTPPVPTGPPHIDPSVSAVGGSLPAAPIATPAAKRNEKTKEEPYEGEVLTYTPGNLNFSRVYAVIVSGDFPNPCGHALLFVPKNGATSSNDGFFLQVAGARTYPRIMNAEGYERYLRTHNKTELNRYAVWLANPVGAVNRLVDLMMKPWVWLILPHNCAAFVEDVVSAGGSSAGLYSNCPRLERFK